jgi:FlaA1/EpsC-like NDP-sugar epimerase
MVTGAGGSIGSEICRQLCRFKPSLLLLVEQAENNLFHIHRELLASFPDVKTAPCIADVTDVDRMEELFAAHRPQVVFHAAAHKHVPMMEWNPGEAVKNNVFGTKTVVDLAHRFEAARFVMISTDKAVNPTSVMGVSKRTSEIYVQSLSQRSRTKFVTVRFGNVLGSAGSVIPIFREQIAAGGPVTVTHPEMQRYFMTIPEASQLVLQAGAMGDGGEIFILDMGEPVRIADLARDLITLSGLTPGVDIDIKFTGMRPGEKLFEELSVDDENAEKTRHPKIFVGKFRPYQWEALQRQLRDLLAVADERPQDVRKKFAEIVPEYRPDGIKTPAPVAARAATLRVVGGG